MAERNPTLKLDDNPQQITMVGPLLNHLNQHFTWEDKKNPSFIKTFYLYTVADAGGNKLTLFAAEHVHNMLHQKVSIGQAFTIWQYGRKGSSGKFFGDTAIRVGSEECFAGEWDIPSGTSKQQPVSQQEQVASPTVTPVQQQVKTSPPDDIGMMVECFTYAARVLLATPVQAAYKKLEIEPTFEDLRAMSISFYIERNRKGERASRSPRYLYENLTFTPPEDTPVSTEVVESEPESEPESEFNPDDIDLPF